MSDGDGDDVALDDELDDELDDDVDQDEGDGDELDSERLADSAAVRVLQYLLGQIVDDPAAVRIEITPRRSDMLLEVQVGPDDMGRVIGRRGRTASAIRTVIRAAAAKDGTDAEVDFVD